MRSLETLIPDLVKIAKEAGQAILDIYLQPTVAVYRKKDHSPLTDADLVSHEIIQTRLRALTPSFPVLSEEGEPQAYFKRRLWSSYWLVDPLDGTREFIEHRDEFSICIALVVKHRPRLGFIYAPVTGVGYFAIENQGAYKRGVDGQVVSCRVARASAQRRLVLGHTPIGARTQRFLDQHSHHAVLRLGSALKFGLLAEGGADAYLRYGLTSEWDTAAGQLILEEAGGRVVDLSGKNLHYNLKRSLLNPSFLAVGDVKLIDELLPLMNTIYEGA